MTSYSSSSLSTFENVDKIKSNDDSSSFSSRSATLSSTDENPKIITAPTNVTGRQILSRIPLLGRVRSRQPQGTLPPTRPTIRWSHPRGKASPNKVTESKETETTPLLPPSSLLEPRLEPLNDGDFSLDLEDSQQHPDSEKESQWPSLERWKILKERIDHGDLLLTGLSNERLEDKVSQLQSRKQYEIQRAINEIRQGMEFNLSHCLLAIFLYLAISIICFNYIFEPEWSIVDSCYFAMVTVTTVGYGDEVPTSPASIVFTCIYSCLGVAILGVALGILGTKLLDAQDVMASKAGNLLKFQVLNVFDPTSHIQRTRQAMAQQDDELDYQEQNQLHHDHMIHDEDNLHKPSFFRSLAQCLKNFLPLACLMLGMAYWIGHRAGWSFLEITYFMIVTATTVGYGDFTPQTDEEKLIAIIFIPIAVGATGAWLGGVAHLIVESYSAKYRRDLCMKELTQKDLDVMDSNHDGKVSRAEYLEFMLVAMKKIDQALVDELRAHFDRLDVDGTGELTREDLIEAARKKLKSPAHKLQLAMYKKHLLEQCKSNGGGRTRRLTRVSLFGVEWGNERRVSQSIYSRFTSASDDTQRKSFVDGYGDQE